MLSLNNRRFKEDENGISFKTPESWLDQPGVRSYYENMIFDRKARSKDAEKRILGVGHKVIDQALQQTQSYQGSVTALPKDILECPLIAFEIRDQITTEGGTVRKAIAAVEIGSLKGDTDRLLKDWELIERLNELSERRGVRKAESAPSSYDLDIITTDVKKARLFVEESLGKLDLPFKFPVVELCAIIWPSPTE